MLLEHWRIAAKVLRAHKFRSALTVLSITVGAFSIVLMSSLADSGLTTLSHGLDELGGARLIDIFPKPAERAEGKQSSYEAGLTVGDWDQLGAVLPHVAERSRFAELGRKDAAGDSGRSARTDLVAADGTFLELFGMRLERGRGFSEEENRHHAKLCVVGYGLAKRLWDGDAMDRWLTIDGLRCRVIGQLADQERWGIDVGFDWREVAIVPYAALRDEDVAALTSAEMLFKTDDPSSNDVVKRVANAILVERHHGVDDFEIFDFHRLVDRFDHMVAIMKAIVGFIAGIALLVGGVGVMNMMLVSVSERVREIGVRKALGASPSDIASQFVWEAIALAGSGGLLGAGGGVAVALVAGRVIAHFKPMWCNVVATQAVVAALVVSVGVGLLFGWFPARRAARLDPVTAMRR